MFVKFLNDKLDPNEPLFDKQHLDLNNIKNLPLEEQQKISKEIG